ncbi:hypothetical protein [Archangium violaceum]|uniref:hypothetical protein n=1 Tax=Archangium violaceum TaxID=83451 RepID=UPI0037C13568
MSSSASQARGARAPGGGGIGRLRYVLAHGVKEGLVDWRAEWPGLTCLPQLLGPARKLFR